MKQMHTCEYFTKRIMKQYNDFKMLHAPSVDGRTLQQCIQNVERPSSPGVASMPFNFLLPPNKKFGG
jgi:hypothetical protein